MLEFDTEGAIKEKHIFGDVAWCKRLAVLAAIGSKRRKRRRGQRLELFTTGQAGRVLGIPSARVRRLVTLCNLHVHRRGRRYLLAFRDIALLRQVIRLSNQTRTARELRTVIEAWKNQGWDWKMEGTARLRSDTLGLVVEEGSAYREYTGGQLLLPFPNLVERRRRQGAVVKTLDDFREPRAQACAEEEEDSAERWYSLAIAREEAGDLEGARQAYLAALRFDPNLSDACVNLGRLAHYEGFVERAAEWYRRAMAIAPDDPIAHYNLAIALEDLGNLPAAVAEYQRALECDWEFPEAHFNLSRLLRALGQQLAAMRHLRVYRQLTGSYR